ncbi:MAG: RdgB/HAM1 family non-canonical purine NTP pyrophosphatase [Proteobacteria bacterium]|nr:RdgB/HAM1 family non-canonical purine NTP pyrophosphatase [Pseudomonadota bacterium]
MRKVVLASGNAGKIREITDLFCDLGIEVVTMAQLGIDSPEETGETFVENALLKARHVATRTGLPAVADDSGIVVDALDGRPGVHSARYAGENASDEQNVQRLLDEMNNVPDEDRGGGFHCAAVLAFPDNEIEPLVAEAVWRGRILRQRSGHGGFGYDPVFLDVSANKTGAEMSRDEKNVISHRGQAFRQLKRLVRERCRIE